MPALLRLQRHNGRLVAVTATPDVTGAVALAYNVLDPQVTSASDSFDWSGFQPLPWPDLVSPAGAGMVRVAASTVPLAGNQVCLASDDRFLSVFVDTTDGSVAVARYALVAGASSSADAQTGGARSSLRLAVESRFRVGGDPYAPADDSDALAATGADGVAFVEPACLLTGVGVSPTLGFTAFLTPAAAPAFGTWHVAAPSTDGGELRIWGFPRDADGRLDLTTTAPGLAPDQRITLRVPPATAPGTFRSAPAGIGYYQQEPIGDDPAVGVVRVKRNARALIVAAFAADATADPVTAVLDLAVAADGTLGRLGPDPTVGPAECTAPELTPASHSLGLPAGTRATAATAVDLGAGFTIEAWVEPGSRAVNETATVTDGDRDAPRVGIENGGQVVLQYGLSGIRTRVVTDDLVLRAGVWQHVAAVAGTDEHSILVNGSPCPVTVTRENGGIAGGVSRIGSTVAGRDVAVDEIRLWTATRSQEQLREWMYRTLDDAERRSDDLAAYWTCDAITSSVDPASQLQVTIPDASGRGHTLTLDGARPQQSSPPVATGGAPHSWVDERGLIGTTGVYPAAPTTHAPALLDSADGLLHLYIAAPTTVLEAATYDTTAGRASWQVGGSPGWELGARTTGVTGNELDISVGPDQPPPGASQQTPIATEPTTTEPTAAADPRRCTLSIAQSIGAPVASETWYGAPRRALDLAACLAGTAAADPTDPRIRSGVLPFYDYLGRYPTVPLICSPAGPADDSMLLVSRRPTPGSGWVPGALPLADAQVDLTDDGATLLVRFAAGATATPVRFTWSDLPTDPAGLATVLAGVDTTHDYAPDPGDNPVYPLLTTGASPVLLIGLQPTTTFRLIVEPDPDTGTCTVRATITVTDNPIHRTWTAVPLDVADFVATLSPPGSGIGDYAVLTDDGLGGRLGAQEVDTPADLRAICPLMQLVITPASTPVTDTPVTAARILTRLDIAELAEPADDEPERATVPASRLVVPQPVPEPGDGQPFILPDGPAALAVPGVGGGWQAPLPGFGLAFSNAVASTPIAATDPIDLAGPVTLEAWVRPDPVPGDPIRTYVVAHTSRPVAPGAAGRGFLLGLRPNLALGSSARDGVATTVTAAPGALGAELQGSLAFTALLWINPTQFTTATDVGLLRLSSSGAQIDLALTANLSLVATSNGASVAVAIPSWDRWTGVGVTASSGELHLVLDGVRQPTALTVPADWVPTDLVIGDSRVDHSADVLFNDLRVYRTALSDSALAEIAVAGPASGSDPDLALWWPLDTRATVIANAASSGTALDGTLTGPHYWGDESRLWSVVCARDDVAVGSTGVIAPERWTHLAATSVPGTAVAVGSTSWGDCGTDPALSPSAEGFTIASWVRPATAASGTTQVIASRWGSAADDQAYELRLEPGGRPSAISCWRIGSSTRTLMVIGKKALTDGRASHLAATVRVKTVTEDGADPALHQTITLVLLVDGEEVADTSFSHVSGGQRGPAAEPVAGESALTLGRRWDAATAFTGLLSQVAWWRQGLTASEVGALLREHTTGISTGPATTAAWPFDEGQGATAADANGNSPCRLTGTVAWDALPEATLIRLFCDGQQLTAVSDVSRAELPVWGPAQVSVGGRLTATTPPAAADGYRGQVDEVRLWSTARTVEQIADTMRVPVPDTSLGLAGAWRMDAGSGARIPDDTGSSADLQLTGTGLRWVAGTAPVSSEGSAAVAVPGGPDLGAVRTDRTPAVAEYPDLQRSADGDLIAVMKRCYGHLPVGSDTPVLSGGFLAGELAVVHLGQVNTKPNVVGYLEGAPPVPSENLTQAYWFQTGWSDYRYYVGKSKVTLTESAKTSYSFAGTRKDALVIDASVKGGFAADHETTTGFGLLTSLTKLEAKIFAAFAAEFAQADEDDNEAIDSAERDTGTSQQLTGDWEPAPGAYPVGRRFLADNTGIAVVKSLTADLFATVSRDTGALVSLHTVPNAAIPLDVNLIPFPINPGYTRAASLDGQIGFTSDGGATPSYFRPIEAYAWRRAIERANAALSETYESYKPKEAGHSDQTTAQDVAGEAPGLTGTDGVPTVGALNSWVWSAAGGTRVERTQYASTRSEKITGSYDRKLQGGLDLMGKFILGGPGFGIEADFMIGQHLEISASKQQTDDAGFGVEVEVEGEPYLKGPLPDDPAAYTDKQVPGKVDGYRAMTFYLPSDTDNITDLFDEVIDPTWLAMGGDSAAVALREAHAESDTAWRVLHRVTYVSRVPPEFGGDPVVSPAELARVPLGLIANTELVDLVTDRLPPRPDRAAIADAVAEVLGLVPGSGRTLASVVPWWAAYVAAAATVGSDQQQVVTLLRAELVGYIAAGYASGALPASQAPGRLGLPRSAHDRTSRRRRRARVTRDIPHAGRG